MIQLCSDPSHTMDQPPSYTIDTLRNQHLISLLQQHPGFQQFFLHLAKRTSPDADATLLQFFFLFDTSNWIQDGQITLPNSFNPDERPWRSILYGTPEGKCWIISKTMSNKSYFFQYDYVTARWERINRADLMDYLWNMLYDLYLNFMQYHESIMSQDDYLTILDHYQRHVMQLNKSYIGQLIQSLMPMFHL